MIKLSDQSEIESVIENFRSATDVDILNNMQSLIDKVNPAFRKEAEIVYDHCLFWLSKKKDDEYKTKDLMENKAEDIPF